MRVSLADLCSETNRWFAYKLVFGNFEVVDGEIFGGEVDLYDKMCENQYYRIVGSVFNDGIHKHPTADLVDEVFDGAIWLMAVPKDFLDLLDEINAWADKNAEALDSPFQSESFGGYSYTKKAGAGGSGKDLTWRSHFKARLNKWRKIRA